MRLGRAQALYVEALCLRSNRDVIFVFDDTRRQPGALLQLAIAAAPRHGDEGGCCCRAEHRSKERSSVAAVGMLSPSGVNTIGPIRPPITIPSARPANFTRLLRSSRSSIIIRFLEGGVAVDLPRCARRRFGGVGCGSGDRPRCGHYVATAFQV